MAKKRKPTKEESDYMDFVRAMGCIVCGKPCEIHHMRGLTTLGMGQRAGSYLTIPLCREHHHEMHQRMSVGGVSESELMNQTIKAVTESIIDGNW